MLKTLVAAAIVLTLTPSVALAAVASCCDLPTPVAAFSARGVISVALHCLVVTSDPRSVASLKVSGREAGINEYAVIYDILNKAGASNAAEVASTAGKSLERTKTLTLTTYFDRASRDIGLFLEQNGVMDCTNAVSSALELFRYIRRSLKGLDMSKFESYQRGIIQGLFKYILFLGFSGEDAPFQLAEISLSDDRFS
ncbi:hypothetical protein JTE90_025118 [Oedothorax gibbosus]|uniref:Uncharacterized protein n=1 Tax=Oedothorax gibbosus TaxID=931172 RepID=A0AAV6U2I7_9ARAC|nr:hypothetical protein JTE90_025118 [Oedothorax gibbosus]